MIRCVRIWTAEDGNSSFEELDCSDADLFGWIIEGLPPPQNSSSLRTRSPRPRK
jgi:succinate dehydrogenase flavin-adding protein (antitoxin of CptAB toxin-antitoxin module)